MKAIANSLSHRLTILCTATLVALAAAALAIPAAKAAHHDHGAPGVKMYIIDGFRFYVRKHSQPGKLSVDLGVQEIPGSSIHGVIILEQGGIPPRSGFHRAANRYLQTYIGNCRITDFYSQTDAEFRYTYACR